MRESVVLLSPNLYGDYAICVAELLARRGIRFEAIFVRRLASVGRLHHELRNEGLPGFARKVARKLIFRNIAHKGADHETIADFKKRERIGYRSLAEFAEAHGASLHTCGDFNEEAVCTEIRRLAPAVTVFTGGGLLRAPLLDAAERRIVGCHPGLLPDYRGMDCLEWAVLEGRPDKLGLTTFLIDEGVDTGPIVSVHPATLQPTDMTFERLRSRLEPETCRALVEAVEGLVTGRLAPRAQARADGRQFFTLHPAMRHAADLALARELGR